MRDSLTDITVILDRSGSMESIVGDAIGGLNTFVGGQKALPGEANFTLVQFDSEYEVVHRTTPIRDVGTLGLVPRGATALLDAIGRTINDTGSRLGATAEADRPGKVVVVILTDGMENASKEFTRPKILEMIKHQQEQYQWQFLFLAANQDAIAVGAGIGIAAGQAMSFAPTGQGVAEGYNAVCRAVGSYRSGGAAAYSTEDRQRQEKLCAVGAGRRGPA